MPLRNGRAPLRFTSEAPKSAEKTYARHRNRGQRGPDRAAAARAAALWASVSCFKRATALLHTSALEASPPTASPTSLEALRRSKQPRGGPNKADILGPWPSKIVLGTTSRSHQVITALPTSSSLENEALPLARALF